MALAELILLLEVRLETSFFVAIEARDEKRKFSE
jgi:hypothetical protein